MLRTTCLPVLPRNVTFEHAPGCFVAMARVEEDRIRGAAAAAAASNHHGRAPEPTLPNVGG